jgi:hypothetical protein
MNPSTKPKSRTALKQTASWLALVASTTLGTEHATLRADIRLDPQHDQCSISEQRRLIVQIYASDLPLDPCAAEHLTPSGSLQRSVSARDLAQGVSVQLLFPDPAQTSPRAVIAWLEADDNGAELDASSARPRPGTLLGTARVHRSRSNVSVQLTRQQA